MCVHRGSMYLRCFNGDCGHNQSGCMCVHRGSTDLRCCNGECGPDQRGWMCVHRGSTTDLRCVNNDYGPDYRVLPTHRQIPGWMVVVLLQKGMNVNLG
jgi:hypothetical protein